MLSRREFLRNGTGGAVALAAVATGVRARAGARDLNRRLAPQLDLARCYAGPDPVAQIRCLAAEGFQSLSDTCLRAKPSDLQAQIGRELARRGMWLACFTGVIDFGRPTFASGRRDLALDVLRELRSAIEVARRTQARSLSIVLGQRDASLTSREQMRNAVQLLHRCADICEPRGITLLLEPVDHGPGSSRLFVQFARHAAELCRAVARPCCRVLVDVRQPAAADGDVPGSLREVGDVLGHIEVGGVPGARDIDRVVATLDPLGYRGAIGIDEHLELERPRQRPIA